MKSKAVSYSASDWVMLLALVQAVRDLLTPGSSFHATVTMIFISVVLRMARYVYEVRQFALEPLVHNGACAGDHSSFRALYAVSFRSIDALFRQVALRTKIKDSEALLSPHRRTFALALRLRLSRQAAKAALAFAAKALMYFDSVPERRIGNRLAARGRTCSNVFRNDCTDGNQNLFRADVSLHRHLLQPPG